MKIIGDLIFDEENGKNRELQEEQLMNMTKMKRKTWKIRVLRYSPYMPIQFFEMDPCSCQLRHSLKSWVKENKPKDGDQIFKGKFSQSSTDIDSDWLTIEIEAWRKRIEHDVLSEIEIDELLS